MRSAWIGIVVAGMACFTACAGPGAHAPGDAAIDDFCATKEWFVTEGLDRFRGGEFPPSEDAVADLAQDWADEFTRVGTPANMSTDARAGFEKFVDRIDDMDGADMPGMNWGAEDWENDEETAFARYVTNTCG